MLQKVADTVVANQVELAVRRMDSVFMLPQVAAGFLNRLSQSQSSSGIIEIIESDPALTVMFFCLARRQNLSLTDGKFSMSQILDNLPIDLIRQAFFSVNICPHTDIETAKQLLIHCLAVACCAKDIAENASIRIETQLAYTAGLLHDIGKLALCQQMPKSFLRLVEEAKSKNSSSIGIEQQHLGIDHTILGKRLAQKWHFPEQITLAIWLHHSNTEAISQTMAETTIAQTVRLADTIVRYESIGQSGSYDTVDFQSEMLLPSWINLDKLQQIRKNLAEQVEQKSNLLGLNMPDTDDYYSEAVSAAAGKLAKDNAKLSSENNQLQSASSHLDFITDFLINSDPAAGITELAEDLAVRWQKFYQTGAVCLYLTPKPGLKTLEAVIVENLAQSKIVNLKAPTDAPAIPDEASKTFAILDASDYTDWLFGQLDVDFEPNHTKLIPLLSNGRAVGAVVFELRYPQDAELFGENFRASGCVGGAVLEMAYTCQNRQRFAEQFARLLKKKKKNSAVTLTDSSLTTLAALAAGAAHELNNPLFVISGRAQLLIDSETDPQKEQLLEQIRKNTGKLSDIIEDLMNFSSPRRPAPASTLMKQILDEALYLAARKTNRNSLDVHIDISDGMQKIFVDSGQVASAIANVFANSVESCGDKSCPVKVTATPDKSADFAKLQITDSGCGMDSQTLEKATQPFFSSRPAGRKRGMGLAHAKRLIQLNNGSLNIESRQGTGTKVTILLPLEGY